MTQARNWFNVQRKHCKGTGALLFSLLLSVTNSIHAQNISGRILTAKDTLDTPHKLKEVVVNGNETTNKADRVVYFPTRQERKHAYDGLSLLNNLMIPQISVDMRKREVTYGEKTVTLMIDGRPVNDDTEIKSLRPADIKRVEFHELPTGEFSQYDCVVNYITRHQKYGGYVSLTGTQETTYGEGDYFAMARLNHGNSESSLGYNYNYLQDKDIHYLYKEQFTYPDASIMDKTEESNSSLSKEHVHHLFYNYLYSNDSLRWNLRAGYKDSSPQTSYTSSLRYRKDQAESVSFLQNSTEERMRNPYLSFFAKWNLSHAQSLTVEASADYAKNNYDYHYAEGKTEEDQKQILSSTSEDYLKTLFRIYYKKRLKKGWTLGSTLYNSTTYSKSRYLNDGEISWTKLLTVRSRLLADISKQWEKLYAIFQMGIDAIHYSQRSQPSKTYISPKPTLNLSYTPDKYTQIQNEAWLISNYPRLSWFTNVTQAVDLIQKLRGNPNLKLTEQFCNTFSVSRRFPFFTLNFIMYSTYCSPNVRRSTTYDGTWFIQSYMNQGSYAFVLPSLGFSMKLFHNMLRLKMSGGISHFKVSGENPVILNKWSGKVDLQWMYKDFMASLYYYSPTSGAYWELERWGMSARYGGSLSYSRNGFTMEVGTSNPFSSYHATSKINLGIYSQDKDTWDKRYYHTFYVKAAYNFSFGRKHQYTELQTDKYTESAIIKSGK